MSDIWKQFGPIAVKDNKIYYRREYEHRKYTDFITKEVIEEDICELKLRIRKIDNKFHVFIDSTFKGINGNTYEWDGPSPLIIEDDEIIIFKKDFTKDNKEDE